MDTIVVPSARCSAGSLILAASCLGAAAVALAVSWKDQPLSASTYPTRDDFDRDGLADAQEMVLGTLPSQADTDQDAYSDLEEHARGADPLDSAVIPEDAPLSVGMCASQDGDVLTVLTSVFVDDSHVGSVSLEVGVVIRDHAWHFAPSNFRYCRGFVRPPNHTGDRLAGIEIMIPANAVRRRGQLSMFSILRDSTPGGADPVVSILTLKDFSGIIMSIEQLPIGINDLGSGQSSQGVAYRPLAADDQIPSTWNSGEMCVQHLGFTGVGNVSMLYEIESAGCISMDTFCSPGDCAASVGQTVSLPDPAALAGG